MNRTHFHFHFHFHSARWLSTLPYLTALTSRRVLSLKGPQVTPFLQNLITNEIQSLTKPKCSAIYTAFLSSQGRYLLDGFLSLHPSFPQTYLLDVHHHHLPLAISHLRRYNLRGLVEIQETPLSIWFAWKPPSCPTTTSFDSNSTVPFPTVLTYTDPRIQKLGVRYLLQKDVMPKILSQFQLVSEEDYILYKYKQGVPEGSDFISHVSLPLEVNLDFLNGGTDLLFVFEFQ
ncbi:Iron-sulfur clusters incorporation protein [Coelomomyces lativittatus]|nr:Iron-sulfur clusters incorporation protein [Coelomomyces lativittatus]